MLLREQDHYVHTAHPQRPCLGPRGIYRECAAAHSQQAQAPAAHGCDAGRLPRAGFKPPCPLSALQLLLLPLQL